MATSFIKHELVSIKGRVCNLTPLVHQDMIQKTTFHEKY